MLNKKNVSTFVVLFSLIAPSVFAAHPKKGLDHDSKRAAREKRFALSCKEAFKYSTPADGSDELGREICDCTVKESRSEGVTSEAMERETAHIKADPKHKIEDEKLLNAFHHCTFKIIQSG